MRLSKILLAFAGTSIAAMPIAASAATVNPAAKLSISKSVPAAARVAAKRGDAKAEGEGVIVLVLAGAAVVAGVVAATSGDSSPSSP